MDLIIALHQTTSPVTMSLTKEESTDWNSRDDVPLLHAFSKNATGEPSLLGHRGDSI